MNNYRITNGYCCERWFISVAKQLRILSKNPSLTKTIDVLSNALKSKFEFANNFIENSLDAAEYLDLVLKTDCILLLEDSKGESYRVAVDITLNKNKIEEKLQEINRSSFKKARKELGIDRHFVILLPVNYQSLNSFDIADALYTAIDNQEQIINLKESAQLIAA